MPKNIQRPEAEALLRSLRLEFRECKCGPHKHYVLFEGNSAFHYSYPLYATWVANEQVEHYVCEGLLDSEDESLCREGLQEAVKRLNFPTLYEGSLPKEEWVALFGTKCTTARRSIPEYLIAL